MTRVTGTTLRRKNARRSTDSAWTPVLILVGLLAALAPIPWLVGLAGHIAPPDTSAAQPGVSDGSGDPATYGLSYVAGVRGDLKDNHARLSKERRASSYESARAQRLAPCGRGRGRAPSHLDRWLAQELSTYGDAGGPTLVAPAIASEAVNAFSAIERRNDVHPRSLEGDLHTPRGPPPKPLA
jgi:hypothetical protein